MKHLFLFIFLISSLASNAQCDFGLSYGVQFTLPKNSYIEKIHPEYYNVSLNYTIPVYPEQTFELPVYKHLKTENCFFLFAPNVSVASHKYRYGTKYDEPYYSKYNKTTVTDSYSAVHSYTFLGARFGLLQFTYPGKLSFGTGIIVGLNMMVSQKTTDKMHINTSVHSHYNGQLVMDYQQTTVTKDEVVPDREFYPLNFRIEVPLIVRYSRFQFAFYLGASTTSKDVGAESKINFSVSPQLTYFFATNKPHRKPVDKEN